MLGGEEPGWLAEAGPGVRGAGLGAGRGRGAGGARAGQAAGRRVPRPRGWLYILYTRPANRFQLRGKILYGGGHTRALAA